MTEAAKMILLVEDELPFRTIYREALTTGQNYSIIEAEDGEQALEKVAEQKPDLILLDLVLPKKDGFSVLRELKDSPLTKDIPVIVYSVIAEKPEIEQAMKLGASDFTIKGVTPAVEVVDKVKRLLSA